MSYSNETDTVFASYTYPSSVKFYAIIIGSHTDMYVLALITLINFIGVVSDAVLGLFHLRRQRDSTLREPPAEFSD